MSVLQVPADSHALVHVAAAVVLVALGIQRAAGVASPVALPACALVTLVLTCVFAWRAWRRPIEVREISHRIEQCHPDLQGLLLTAVQQESVPAEPSNYFQQELLRSAVEHSNRHRWTEAVPTRRLALFHVAAGAALALVAVMLSGLRLPADTVEGLRPFVEVQQAVPGLMDFIARLDWYREVFVDAAAIERIYLLQQERVA